MHVKFCLPFNAALIIAAEEERFISKCITLQTYKMCINNKNNLLSILKRYSISIVVQTLSFSLHTETVYFLV